MDDSDPKPTEDSTSIPVIQESINYKTQSQESGKVRITKKVREELVEVEESTTYETADINRVPINQYVDELPPPVRYEDDVMIIPVLKEVIVKRVLLVEELHIKKTKETKIDKRTVPLREEEVQIDRVSKEQ